LNGAHTYVERAKSHAVDDAYTLGRATRLQTKVWYRQHRLKEAKVDLHDLCDA